VKLRHWLMFLLLMSIVTWTSRACADEWFSRSGTCFDWRGRWVVDRDQAGSWVGNIDFVHVGGPCGPPTHSRQTDRVRAVIVGDEFLARRGFGPALCMLHGRVQGGEIRGHELCMGTGPTEFTLHLGAREPDERDSEWRDEQREPGPPRR
jgi:hypothetical protein